LDGQIKTVYLRESDVRSVEANAKRNGWSFSRSLRDLLRKGWMSILISEEAEHLKGADEWTD